MRKLLFAFLGSLGIALTSSVGITFLKDSPMKGNVLETGVLMFFATFCVLMLASCFKKNPDGN